MKKRNLIIAILFSMFLTSCTTTSGSSLSTDKDTSKDTSAPNETVTSENTTKEETTSVETSSSQETSSEEAHHLSFDEFVALMDANKKVAAKPFTSIGKESASSPLSPFEMTGSSKYYVRSDGLIFQETIQSDIDTSSEEPVLVERKEVRALQTKAETEGNFCYYLKFSNRPSESDDESSIEKYKIVDSHEEGIVTELTPAEMNNRFSFNVASYDDISSMFSSFSDQLKIDTSGIVIDYVDDGTNTLYTFKNKFNLTKTIETSANDESATLDIALTCNIENSTKNILKMTMNLNYSGTFILDGVVTPFTATSSSEIVCGYEKVDVIPDYENFDITSYVLTSFTGYSPVIIVGENAGTVVDIVNAPIGMAICFKVVGPNPANAANKTLVIKSITSTTEGGDWTLVNNNQTLYIMNPGEYDIVLGDPMYYSSCADIKVHVVSPVVE
jgi:hypothetical protein